MKKGLAVVPLILLVLLPAGMAAAQSVMTLEESIAQAREVSTVVDQSRQQLMVSRQNVLRSWGNLLPDFNLNTYVGRRYIGPTTIAVDDQGREVQGDGFDFESYSFNLDSNILLWDWLGNVKTMQSAQHDEEASKYRLQYQKDVIAAQVVREYYNLVRDEYLIRVAEESVGAAQRNLDQVEAFFAIGSNTKADVLQAQVRLGNTQLEQIVVKNNAEVSRATLATTLQIPLNQPLAIDTSLAITKIEPDLEAEIAYMLGHRPDLLGTQELMQSSSYNSSAVRRTRWPTLAASFSYRWNDRFWDSVGFVFDNEYAWNVGLSINWPIFDRYQRKSNIINAEAQERIAELTYTQAKLDAILQVKTIYLSLNEAQERARVARQTAEQGRENLRLAMERYRVGAGTILETNDAQVSLTQALADLVTAHTDYKIARANLQLATGRPVRVD